MGRAPRTCPACKGEGTVKEYDPLDKSTDHVKCGRCNGTGQI